ncbi:glycine--tRNA ligase [Candidatus Adlerbacteria bacterium RIFCSPHIGHO2_01_FULL_54_23]|uniref:Glycine--tRNA ligase n=3 Tax=Candidatus Adleribacteriota TaxID=1752736 RepID=A0A1F4Y1N7_9BACT|nr:MAG: Glycine-tRNA ligase [Candidatus Adlerbacteria bacterium GW2011_GWA1_54_10]KKW36304.1 MAG: Glycine-tRNA ligase [Candidatus Adlerbacteria bacterium GW2011_GWA2_54_12]KKW37834.1 MAG: Glycine-tRNA ligase [Candidatus Adlerbacteria bacterium GW2011_GWB1_54_7]OGC78865.1 MAG: glycine--tRNA ligase [Candidatus Adlerbacteria bacterium RIFCSPHIGHO2_01_FULL_54_23]OGC87243.1 MAG: glycine--tRNA ligase [Candidatus Adlerbacteria bacterium RIFCSPLOWO2_01_FULL_54_16]
MARDDLMEKVVSLCKRRGFVYQGSEIYGGLAGMWDYAHYGLALKNNIKQLWWHTFVDSRDDMYGIDTAVIMNPKAWESSGHISSFADPLGDKMFNTMFKTSVGAGEEAMTAYLRPETAGGIFVNFKNVVDSFHPVLPFGIAQIGKVFRNEIAPRDFIFRVRELEQMEVEYFVRPSEWERYFEEWRKKVPGYLAAVGIDMDKVHELDVPDAERAHYSKRTIDFEFDFPFGTKELCGLAYRTSFDLSAHERGSGVELRYVDQETGEKIVPHVIEPSFGVDRTVLAVLLSAYAEDDLGRSSAEASEGKGEKRILLKFNPSIAPVKAAVFPLLKNKPELVTKAREIYSNLKSQIPNTMWDDNGNIGKRYRRQDEIGTPWCITVDFETLENNTVTVRDRDSGGQKRVEAEELVLILQHGLAGY